MPYTNCAACGAKALVGATRCPRCQAPFVSYDPKGDRVPTVNCPNCGVQRPVAIGVCPNCLTSTAPAGARLTRGFTMIGIGIAVIVGVGYLYSRRVSPAPPPVAAALQPDSAPVTDTLVDTAATAATATAAKVTTVNTSTIADTAAYRNELARTLPASVPAVAAKPVDPAMIPPKPAAPPKVAVPDTGVWEFAVASTWVRVRSAPTRDSDVLRMVDSAQKVRLGPPMNGWRPIRVGVDRGWVDPRLFTLVPSGKP